VEGRGGVTPYYEDEHITLWNEDVRDFFAEPPLDCDVLLTDPPYGIAYNSGSRRDTLAASIKGDQDTSLRDAVLAWWGPGAPALVFGTWRIPRPVGTHTRLIWDTKGALGMGDLSVPWKPSDQEIYVLGKGFVGRRDSNVLSCAPVQSMARNGRQHPHEKPVDLLVRLLDKCPPGVVLDPFAGSGSTLVAAKMVGRQAVGIEIEKAYCDIAVQRVAQDSLPFGGAA
jgi:DNA modification methylase